MMIVIVVSAWMSGVTDAGKSTSRFITILTLSLLTPTVVA